ncbi:MAG: glycosyltransferase family 2 protein [Deltaproteobacteria bacterium]|nr:glycosyltransferase family 2 protein [Deltaproteobacteria bacterium]
MISIIMPSYLGPYKGAAKNRDEKIVRAIQSVQSQTYEEWELIVVADGCDKTVSIVQTIAEKCFDTRIKVLWITKQPTWSGKVRNTGLKEAKGEYMCYLDIDDAFAPDHLEGIAGKLNGKDWYWTDDYVWNGKEFRHRKCNILKVGQCGTSNLIHKKIAWWNEKDSYAHDWNFIKALLRTSREYEYITGGKYLVCHVPRNIDV